MKIKHELGACYGAGETTKIELVADTDTGETEIVVRKTLIEHFPLKEYEKASRLYEGLNRGGGRRVWTLNDLTK